MIRRSLFPCLISIFALSSLLFGTIHRTFASEEPEFDEELYNKGEWGDQITTTKVSEIDFRPDKTLDYFVPAKGARIIEGWE